MRICFIGDSFVNGTGDPECLGWSGRICSAACKAGLDVTYYNLGIRRDTSHDIAVRWQREAALRLPPDFDGRLVFSFGVVMRDACLRHDDCSMDDAGHPRLSPEIASTALRTILEQATRWLPTLMIGPPPIGEPDVNERIQARLPDLAAACAETAVPHLDVFDPLSRSAVWMHEVSADDGAHPGADGYALLADLVRGLDGVGIVGKTRDDRPMTYGAEPVHRLGGLCPSVSFRAATADDLALLWRFLAIAAYEVDAEAAMTVPVVASHLAGWPRPGDFGVIAERSGEAIGAAWARQFHLDENPSFYVDQRTPEVSIGVLADERGRGVGMALLAALKEQACHHGLGLCLNVRDNNPAVRLYERAGFRRVPGSDVRNRTGGLSIGMALYY